LQNNNYNIKDENLVSYMHNLLAQNKESQLAKISFNLNRTESNLKTISNDSLDFENAQIINANNLVKHQKEIENNFNGTQLWRWFLLAAIAFVLLEVILLKIK
jgi:hypothetical protein